MCATKACTFNVLRIISSWQKKNNEFLLQLLAFQSKIWIYMRNKFVAVAAFFSSTQTQSVISKAKNRKKVKKNCPNRHGARIWKHRIYKQRDVSLQDSRVNKISFSMLINIQLHVFANTYETMNIRFFFSTSWCLALFVCIVYLCRFARRSLSLRAGKHANRGKEKNRVRWNYRCKMLKRKKTHTHET